MTNLSFWSGVSYLFVHGFTFIRTAKGQSVETQNHPIYFTHSSISETNNVLLVHKPELFMQFTQTQNVSDLVLIPYICTVSVL